MRQAFVAAALVLALPWSAGAQEAAESVTVRTRADAVGDLYRFRSEARYAERNADGDASQTNSQAFDVEVLGVTPDGLKLRYTLREASLTDSSGPSMETALKALIGVPLEFRLRHDGTLAGLDNWEAFKTRVLAGVDAALPRLDTIRNIYHQRFAQEPLYAAQDMVLGDVRLMAIMEPVGPTPLGSKVVTDFRRSPPGRALSDVRVLKAGCTVRVTRAAVGGSTGVRQDFTTDAVVSSRDGRVITLAQRRVERAGASSVDESVNIRRVSPAPAC
ncbi:MAG: hypothetical protein JNK30_15440 [Phenylobacterium sp.]|uniref:hypothetical protein n=1 Tax=Phenylobacterium sp. TaxID=1871053 RepID=UPI001A5CDD7A|nr:hypothetical protein [Phenylobacterium sp.]MBL8772775.1 hypothetical protein [Phenylobacterium sp.]